MTGPVNAYFAPSTSAWDPALPGGGALSNANRTFTVISSTNAAKGTKSYPANAAGAKYFEVLTAGDNPEIAIGLVTAAWTGPHVPGLDAEGLSYYSNPTGGGGGLILYPGTAYGVTYTNGDRIGVRLNNGILSFYKNGASQGPAFDLVALGLGSTAMFPSMGAAGTAGTVIGTIYTGNPLAPALPSGATAWG